MKTKILVFSLLLLTICSGYMKASNDSIQVSQEQRYKYAISLLDGVNTRINYTKARHILSKLASQGYAPAMRTWGTMYNNGLGVPANKELAFKAYHKASKLGDAKSMTNLGLMYQNGDYVKVNYEKAMNWYEKGLYAGDKRNYYNVGYLYYKGYGVEQSYPIAFQYFLEGATDKNDGICKYMIGLCYIKGYGVEVNEELGRSWIEKAANNGYERAIDFILNYRPREKRDSAYSKGITSYLPANRLRSKSDMKYNADFSGEWEGMLYIMDWSKQIIEEKIPLSLTITKNADQLEGAWTLNGEVIPFMATQEEFNWKIYDAPSLKKLKGGSQKMLSCDFLYDVQGESETLHGNIQIERLKTKEPAMPNYFSLKKVAVSDEKISSVASDIKVWPNPIIGHDFTISIKVSFEQNISIRIYDINGSCVYAKSAFVHSGRNNLTVNTDLNSGIYTIYVEGQEDFVHTCKIIKK